MTGAESVPAAVTVTDSDGTDPDDNHDDSDDILIIMITAQTKGKPRAASAFCLFAQQIVPVKSVKSILVPVVAPANLKLSIA